MFFKGYRLEIAGNTVDSTSWQTFQICSAQGRFFAHVLRDMTETSAGVGRGGGGVPSTRQVIRYTRKSHYQTFVTISVCGIGIRNSFTEAPQKVGAHAPLSKHASEIGNPVVQPSNQNMKQWTPGNNTNAYRWRCVTVTITGQFSRWNCGVFLNVL